MLSLAIGTSRKDTAWKNTQLSWKKLVQKLETTTRTKETVKQYHTFEDERKANIKDSGGFVGGMLVGGRRKKENIMNRSLVTLDLDFVDFDVWAMFQLSFSCAACMYSTHSHRPEKPRLRIIIPLDREVFLEEYEAIARRVASMLDIEACDPTTYEANRLMYWPSTPVDGEYVFEVQEGAPLSADEMLATYKDWKDINEWPSSSKEKKLREHRATKIGVPYLKAGVIGAFCSEYSITSAIESFLPDVYSATGDPERYTYVKGTTHGGLKIHDDDTYAFSHHSTDPTCNQLCNAFDLVRIHKFGALDADKDEETPINKMPSYLAMLDLATGDKRVKVRLIAAKIEGNGHFKDDMSDDTSDTSDDTSADWMGELKTDRKGNVQSTVDNYVSILTNDGIFRGKIGYDLFENREVWMGDMPWGARTCGQPLIDSDDAHMWKYIELLYNISDTRKLHAAVQIVAKANAFHPVRDWITSVPWDGVERAGTLFIDFLGVADNDYTRTVTRKFLCAAVARVFEPGIKFDTMLVLVGRQGAFKSQILDRLGGRWFSDSLDTVQGKEALEALQGAWIIEMAELTGVRKADVNKAKQFVSKRKDRFRVAYGHRVEEFPRQCVFAGTSNTHNFLRDQSGNRRFWPLVVNPDRATRNVFEDLTPEVIAQVWAEAKVLLDQGETIYLSREMEVEAAAVQNAHTEEDTRIGIIEHYLSTPIPANWSTMSIYDRRAFLQSDAPVDDFDSLIMRDKVCVNEIWAEALCVRTGEPMPSHVSADVHEIMQRMPGWIRGNKCRFGIYGPQICYQRAGREETFTQVAEEVAAFLD